MIRTSKPSCRQPLENTVTITLRVGKSFERKVHSEFVITRYTRKCDICVCFLLRSETNYWDAEKITDPPAVAFTFCATSKRAINRPKTDPRLLFFLNLFINGQAFIISGKKFRKIFLKISGGGGRYPAPLMAALLPPHSSVYFTKSWSRAGNMYIDLFMFL